MNSDSHGAIKRLVLHVKIRCGSLSITTPVVNEFYVQSLLHGQVSLAAVNHIFVVHEVMNGCKLKACFENVDMRS